MNTRAVGLLVLPALVVLTSAAGSCRAVTPDAVHPLRTYTAASLYNQGNAEARGGKAAAAVLSYERARVLDPLDSDIRTNLQTVRQRAGLPVQADGWFTQHFRFVGPNTMYWWGIVGLMLIGGGLIGRQLVPTRRSLTAALVIVGFVIAGLAACDVVAIRSLMHESVVMRAAAVHASPVSGSEPLLTLAAAEVVQVEDEHQDFVLVRDATGRQGWVARRDLEPVIPADPVT